MLDLDINEEPLTHENLINRTVGRMGKALLLRTTLVMIDLDNRRLVISLDAHKKLDFISIAYNEELDYDLIDIKHTLSVPGRNILDIQESLNDYVVHLLYRDNMLYVDDIEEYEYFLNHELNRTRIELLWAILGMVALLGLALWFLFTR